MVLIGTTARNLNRTGAPDPIAMRIMDYKTRAMYDHSNIVDEQDIGLALTQAEAHRKRSSHTLATSAEMLKGSGHVFVRVIPSCSTPHALI